MTLQCFGNSTTYALEIAQLLSEYLIATPTTPLELGGFILEEVKHPFKIGELLFYLSYYDGAYLFSKARNASGRRYLYCFLCPRSRSCSHISMVGTLGAFFHESEEFDSSGGRSHHPGIPVREIQDTSLSKDCFCRPSSLDRAEDMKALLFPDPD